MATTITSRIETVTPEVARKFLAKNMGNNRKLSMGTVSAITKQILAGEWKVTNAAIGFDTNGDLIDGQHRLNAIINADLAVTMVVVRGLEPSVRYVLDSGKRRNPSDVMFMAGHKVNGALKAATARFAFTHYNKATHRTTDAGGGQLKMSNDEMVAWVEDNSVELEHSIKVASRLHKWWGGGSLSGIVYAHMALSRINKKKADKFFDELSTGVGSGSKKGAGFDPRTALAKTIQDLRRDSPNGRGAAYVYLIATAFDAWDTGKFIPSTIPMVDSKTGLGYTLPASVAGWWV